MIYYVVWLGILPFLNCTDRWGLVGMPIKKPVTISDNRHSACCGCYCCVASSSKAKTLSSNSDKSLRSSANCTSLLV